MEDNYGVVINRLKRTRNRLEQDSASLQRYDEIFKDQLTEGIIEKVNETMDDVNIGNITYLPHREVIRQDKKSTAIIIVFDASTKGNYGISLNDCLYKSPCLNPMLYDLFLKFRAHPIAITADVEKAYLPISVHNHDRDLLRFLWYDDVFNENAKIIKIRFSRVIFGATSSQFLLNATIRKLGDRYQTSDPEFARKVKTHFYVDDLSTGVKATVEGITLYRNLKDRFKEASFNLRKWRTNDDGFRRKITELENKKTSETLVKWRIKC